MSFAEEQVSTHKVKDHWTECYLHVMLLHVRYCPAVGATTRHGELIIEDGLNGFPAALTILIEVLDKKKL